MLIDLNILRSVEVVGMTTSGAARLSKLMQALGPPIGALLILFLLFSIMCLLLSLRACVRRHRS